MCTHDLLTKLKDKFVKVQLASGVMNGITVNNAFNATATKMVVIHAPIWSLAVGSKWIFSCVFTFVVYPGRVEIGHRTLIKSCVCFILFCRHDKCMSICAE